MYKNNKKTNKDVYKRQLMNAVLELEEAYNHYKNDPEFQKELTILLKDVYKRQVHTLPLAAGELVRVAFHVLEMCIRDRCCESRGARKPSHVYR